MTPSGTSTPTTRQPRIQIPSTLPSLLQTELLLLDRLLRKNKPQHRSGLFYQKCTHVFRLIKRMAVVMNEVVKANESTTLVDGGSSARGVAMLGDKTGQQSSGEKTMHRFYTTLVELVEKTLPAISKASEVLEKMIIHLHFLPLTTTLLAITSRMFVITIDVASYLVQYHETTRNLPVVNPSGSSTPVLGHGKDKERDKVSFSFDNVVEMVVSGRIQNSNRMATAREQLEARLQALDQQAKQDDKGKGRAVGTLVGPERIALLEMDGEDFGEAVEVIPRPAEVASPRTDPARTRRSRMATTIVLDPPSSPDEPRSAQLPDVPGLGDVPASTPPDRPLSETKEAAAAKRGPTAVFASPFSPVIPESLDSVHKSATASATSDMRKQKKRTVNEDTSVTKIPTKRKSSSLSDETRDTLKVKKKKKAKDSMDDIFGL